MPARIEKKVIFEENQVVRKAVEYYLQTGNLDNSEVKVTLLAANKTSYVEQVSGDGRTVLLNEYRLDSRIVWAAYSSRTGTVYLSQAH
jgi:hypothetical protein